jgi:hypothetical protein
MWMHAYIYTQRETGGEREGGGDTHRQREREIGMKKDKSAIVFVDVQLGRES